MKGSRPGNSRLGHMLPVVAMLMLSHARWAYAQEPLAMPSQSLRDPTMEPAPSGVSPINPDLASPVSSAMSVIVVNGRPHVIIGTRLYAQGQKLGQARIERITETEVWLREGAVLRKVSRFPGIERRRASPSEFPECAQSASQAPNSSRVAPRGVSCPDAQP
jgi:hypothetical protein